MTPQSDLDVVQHAQSKGLEVAIGSKFATSAADIRLSLYNNSYQVVEAVCGLLH